MWKGVFALKLGPILTLGIFSILCAPLRAEPKPADVGRRFYASKVMRNVDGRLFPVSVDLADEFPAREESQTGGTCHIHTATGLFAHACYRVTGKWVDLDESYLFFLHMYEFFKVVPFDETGFKGGVSHEDYLKWRKLGPTATITGNDGGNPKDSLDRICSGNCLIAASQETGWVASEIAKIGRAHV